MKKQSPITLLLDFRFCSAASLLATLLVMLSPQIQAASYEQWATNANLTGEQAMPSANPDGDDYVNALEYAFGSNPLEVTGNVGPVLIPEHAYSILLYRVGMQAQGVAEYHLFGAENLETLPEGRELELDPNLEQISNEYSIYSQHIETSEQMRFFRLDVTVPSQGPLGGDPGGKVTVSIVVGTNIGRGYWDGLPGLSNAVIRLQPPAVSSSNATPNRAKYPDVVGASQMAVTQDFLDTLSQKGRRLPRRSWMGWFLWGNSTPPPGIGSGYPVEGTFDTNSAWDFFSYQFPAQGTNASPTNTTWAGLHGSWRPIRLDQQPLYANPFRLNYAWPPGPFGFKTQPLQPFTNQVGYWNEKRIVRGPNLSFANPFFLQYADRVNGGDTPDEWRDSWFYMRTRPLETLIAVPSNLKPNELLLNGTWNRPAGSGPNQPFPYPVWETNVPPQDQTPFAMLVDRMGDWDADIVWEGTHSRAPGYENRRYRRTGFSKPGRGNYLKMTVAQGSPLIWFESNNNKYQIFYNLIRQNIPTQIASSTGTGAGMVPGGPWNVPGVNGVKYVLFYGDHNNPNQWHHDEAPWFYDQPKGQPGGFNPPGAQHNHTYTALFYRETSAQPVTLGNGGAGSSQNNGTDGHGNPYFYLEFKNTGKNWFVVGSVPVMSYYHTGVTVDSADAQVAGARSWAEQMGKYAFNFVTDTKISYSSTNMNLVTTTYSNIVRNPFVAAGDSTASGMTLNNSATIMALLPHQYQPLTLGPDLTKASRRQVTWDPLLDYQAEFPMPANAPPNANKNDPNSTSRWGYWGPRGTMKSIISGYFVTQYPFQNFLPVMPPPNLKTNYDQTGIQVLRITDVGSGYVKIKDPVPVATLYTSSPTDGAGATFEVLLEPNTGKVLQVNVKSQGAGYPDGLPPDTNKVWLVIDPPKIPANKGGRQASARLQIGGGKVLAVFMNDKGAGYESTISVSQKNVTIDPPIILPPYDAAGNLQPGIAKIISGGAGFDFSNTNNPLLIEFVGTGTGAKAEIVQAGQIINIGDSLIGGFTSPGLYPGSGNLTADANRIRAELPPPAPGAAAQGVVVSQVTAAPDVMFSAILDQGEYASKPDASIVDDNGVKIDLQVDFGGGRVINVARKGQEPDPAPVLPVPHVLTPKEVVFANGAPTRPARAKIYGGVRVAGLATTGAPVGGYSGNSVVSFNGGELLPEGVTLPAFKFSISPDGKITNATITSAGTGWKYPGFVKILAGKGYEAAAVPILGQSGQILSVQVLRTGNNYPTNVYATIIGAGDTAAELSVQVTNGQIVGVKVTSAGSGYKSPPNIAFTSTPGGDPSAQPAKGEWAEIHFGVTEQGGITGPNLAKTGSRYIVGTENGPTPDSPRTYIHFESTVPLARSTSPAQGYIARAVSPIISVEQVVYDNLLSGFTSLASEPQKPFGGGFGGLSGPDGYGLGNQLSAAAKFTSVLYNFQQEFARQGKDNPNVIPSGFAFDAANSPISTYELPVYKEHHPMLTLSGGLKASVQGLQRTLSLLHNDPPYGNNPADVDWKMEYFSQYDAGVGRVVLNPSGTIPVLGVVSSVPNPPTIPTGENASKTGLKKWNPGMLWSGFGVSDQWNDQHYFFGYYLGTAGLMSILDRSWETNITIKPPDLWAGPSQLGTAVDQWLMTLAFDPDNDSLVKSLYRKPEFTYQKFAYFDQWNGHGWATGVSPGRAGDVEDGRFGDNVPWSVWHSYGTGNGPYDDENENSIWEGLQGWSSILLWGGGTDRKSVVDLGMYLLATGNAAGDLYFHDKNYNLANSRSNRFSWVPVTTVHSRSVEKNGGNTNTPPNTGFVESTHKAFYNSPEAFGGEGSAGTSILHKGSPSLNNFFYAFPTGSKFIQSFPPAPWTLGMTRNSDYMKRWAGSMMRLEWKKARESALYQPANWLSMAMASAVSGVPYNPGDTPYEMTGTNQTADAPATFVKRLWSSWVTLSSAAGAEAALQPTFKPIEVLTFLHQFEEYGTPDWTYIARATDAAGKSKDDSIVFTAAFSKVINKTTVRTTFVAFNPGWTTRYATFHRLSSDGTTATTSVVPEMPLVVGPKKLKLLTKDFTIQ